MILLLVAATVVLTIVGVVGARHGFPIVARCALVVDRLHALELWRAVTWIFFEDSPWSLLWTGLFLVWFGSDLALRWGAARFLAVYLLLAAGIAAALAAVSVLYAPLREHPYIGPTPVHSALLIIWASYYPSRQMNFFMMVRMTGQQIVLFTVAMTGLFALFYGIDAFAPHFLGEALAFAAAKLPSPRALWIEHKLRGLEKKRRGAHLRSVPRDEAPRAPSDPAGPGGKDDDRGGPPNGRWLN